MNSYNYAPISSSYGHAPVFQLTGVYAVSPSQLYYRGSSLASLSSHPDDMHATTPMPSKPAKTTRGSLTRVEIGVIAYLMICVVPVTLSVLSCGALYLPLTFYFRHEAPYTALTPTAHIELTLWGSFTMTVILALAPLLWYAKGPAIRLKSSWIARLALGILTAYTAFSLAIGVAVAPAVASNSAPAGFSVEHALTLGRWGLVPQAAFLIIVGVVLKALGCFPPVL